MATIALVMIANSKGSGVASPQVAAERVSSASPSAGELAL
jgi:hypothetical protein